MNFRIASFLLLTSFASSGFGHDMHDDFDDSRRVVPPMRAPEPQSRKDEQTPPPAEPAEKAKQPAKKKSSSKKKSPETEPADSKESETP